MKGHSLATGPGPNGCTATAERPGSSLPCIIQSPPHTYGEQKGTCIYNGQELLYAQFRAHCE